MAEQLSLNHPTLILNPPIVPSWGEVEASPWEDLGAATKATTLVEVWGCPHMLALPEAEGRIIGRGSSPGRRFHWFLNLTNIY